MSVENKIRELMSGKLNEAGSYPGMGKSKEESSPMQGSSQKPEIQMLNKGAGAGSSMSGANTLKAGAGAMEKAPMKQGSSQDATIATHDTEATQGKTQSSKAKKQPVPVGKGAGAAPNFSTHADPSSVINQSSSKGNVHQEEYEEYEEDEFITEEEYNLLSDEEKAEYEHVELEEEIEDEDEDEDVEELEEKSFFRPPAGFTKKGIAKKGHKASEPSKKDSAAPKMKDDNAERRSVAMAARTRMKEELAQDVETLFGSETDLSEEFKAKAASLFEAVVTARVAHEMEIMEDVVAEAAAEEVANIYNELVENVDAYLSYVSTQWLEENAVAIESGLRTEITEDFIAGLKVLFQENYIEVPEEKFDVLASMQEEIEELKSKMNDMMNESIQLNAELVEAKRDMVFSKVTTDLAQTESEKLLSLVEEVDFENEEIFEEKLVAIKNNFFARNNTASGISLNEEAPATQEISNSIAKYVEVLSRGK